MGTGARMMYGVARTGEHAGEYTRCRAKDPATCRYHAPGSHRMMDDAQFTVASERLAREHSHAPVSLSKAGASNAGDDTRVDNRGVPLPPRPGSQAGEPGNHRTVRPSRPVEPRGKRDGVIRLGSGIAFGNLDNPETQPSIIRDWSYPGMRFASSERYDNRLALDDDYRASVVMHQPEYLDGSIPVVVDIQRFRTRKGYVIDMEEPRPLRGGRVPESRLHARHPDGRTSIIMRPDPESGHGVYASSRLTRRILDDLHAKTMIHNGNRDPRVDSKIVGMQYDTRDVFTGTVIPVYTETPEKPSIFHPFLRNKWRKARESERQASLHGMPYQYPNDPTGRHGTGTLIQPQA